MGAWPFDVRRGVTNPSHSTDDPVTAAAQAVRLEILASLYGVHPEETSMILERLEIAYLQAGRPDDAAGAHQRRLIALGRIGHADIERWERSPRWFKMLTRLFRRRVQLHWEATRYLHGLRVIDAHLADTDRRTRRKRLAGL
jgi:hypothetical protein